MRRIDLHDTGSTTEINISPLIDMMFLLLIFFIVTTAFVEELGVKIRRPSASASRTLEKKSIMIGVTREGAIYYGKNRLSLSTLRGTVRRLLRTEEQPVIVIADKDSRSGLLIDVVDECKAAGAETVSVATRQE